MIVLSKGNHQSTAMEYVEQLLAGIRVNIDHDLGEYTEVIDALILALDQGGTEGVHRAYSIMKKADPRLSSLHGDEQFYPPNQTFDENDLQTIDRFPYTDAGQGETIAHIYAGRKLRFVPGLGWLIKVNHIWRRDDRGAIAQYALVASRARQNAVFNRDAPTEDKPTFAKKMDDLKWALRSENRSRLENATDLASKHPAVVTLVDDLDSDPLLIGVKNGIVDLRNGRLVSDSLDYMITRRTNIPYVPDAKCPRWESFLNEIFAGDKDLVDYIGRSIGYSLTGDIREHCFWILYGTGRNGKSTFMNILSLLGGDYAANTPFNTFRAGKESQAGEDLARLRGVRIISASEFGPVRLNEERIKAVTGGDPITARFLYGSYFTYYPQFKLWLTSNNKPEILGTDVGIWKRPRLIPFLVKFEGNRADQDLEKKLRLELPGILAWAIRHCREWRQRGLVMPETVQTATAAYRDEMDIIGRFLNECCITQPEAQVKSAELFKAYQEWCNENGFQRPLNNVILGQKLKDRGFESTGRTRNGYFWNGIGLLAEE